MCARIYLNSNLLDMHPHGYTPYLVDLTDGINKGISNHIEISVCNVQPSTGWYRDRNHPCAISYSIGNEIDKRSGRSKGYEWAAKLAKEIRKYDDTKLVTAGICGIWNICPKDAPEDYRKDYLSKYPDKGEGDIESLWDRYTEKYMEPLDIVGYNYLSKRYEHDHENYPERVIWGSETHALDFYHSWKKVMKNSYFFHSVK